MKIQVLLLGSMIALASCGNNAETTEAAPVADSPATAAAAPVAVASRSVKFGSGSTAQESYIAYDSASSAARPIVLVVPEWWGVNEYVRSRANQLAELGYFAIVVDVFGNGKTADNPKDAQALVTPFYTNFQKAQAQLDAALAQAKTYPQADSANAAAIGYCFGGAVVLNSAKLGSNLKGVVSFHGGLGGVAPDRNLLKAQALVLHGNADKFVSPEEFNGFKKQMDSVGVKYQIITYDSAMHAFTNPASTENGKKFNIPIAYNEAADKKSWEDMKAFLSRVFGK